MAALEELFANPKIALGYGLLASRENPIGAAFGLLQQGQELRQNQEANAIRNKLIERQMRGLDIEEMKAQREAEMNDRIMQELEASGGGGGLKTIGALYDRPTLYQYGKDLEEQERDAGFRGRYGVQPSGEQPTGQPSAFNVDLGGLGQDAPTGEQLPPIDGINASQADQPIDETEQYAQSIINEMRKVSLEEQSPATETYLKQLELELKRIDAQRPNPETLFKTQEAADAKATAKSQFDVVLDQMEKNLDALYKGGDIASTTLDPQTNLQRFAENSFIGRNVQAALGTERADLEQKIDNAKPLLLRSLMQATGASSKSMDSNRELQVMLDSLGSPTQTYESRKAALDTIRSMYASTNKDNGAQTQETKPKDTTDSVIYKLHPQHGDITESDIQQTMQENGMSRTQVLQALGLQ